MKLVSENVQNFQRTGDPKQSLGLGLKSWLIALYRNNSQSIYIVKGKDEYAAWTALIKTHYMEVFDRYIDGHPEDPWDIDNFKGRFDGTATSEIDLSQEVTELDID